MDFNAPTIDKKTISIKSAILRVYINTANSATLTIGYNYSTSFDNRKSLLAKITGVSMGTKTGSKTIDITSIVQAYCRDGQTGKFYLWAYGTGGSSSNSNFRGFNPSSSYSSQRPYITLTYDTSRARIYTDGEWKGIRERLLKEIVSSTLGEGGLEDVDRVDNITVYPDGRLIITVDDEEIERAWR